MGRERPTRGARFRRATPTVIESFPRTAAWKNRCPPGGRDRTVGGPALFVTLERRSIPDGIRSTRCTASPNNGKCPTTAKPDQRMANLREPKMPTPHPSRASVDATQKPTFRLRISIAGDDIGLLPLCDVLVRLPTDKARRLHIRQLRFQALADGPGTVSVPSSPVRPTQPSAKAVTDGAFQWLSATGLGSGAQTPAQEQKRSAE